MANRASVGKGRALRFRMHAYLAAVSFAALRVPCAHGLLKGAVYGPMDWARNGGRPLFSVGAEWRLYIAKQNSHRPPSFADAAATRVRARSIWPGVTPMKASRDARGHGTEGQTDGKCRQAPAS